MSLFRTLLQEMAQDYTPVAPDYPVPPPSPLPDTYQEVEYIESTGTQYLDTGLSCSGGIRCKYNATYFTSGYLCGAHNTSYPYGRCGANNEFNNQWELGYGETYNQNGTFSLNTNYDVEYQTYYDNAYLKVKGGDYNDWTTLITENSQEVSNENALIFTNQYKLAYDYPKSIEARLYSLKIYNSDELLIGNFIPCYRKSDNEIGLYNLVDDTFITNQGTGTFLKGPNV